MSEHDNSIHLLDILTTNTFNNNDIENTLNVFVNFLETLNQDQSIRNNRVLRNESSFNYQTNMSNYNVSIQVYTTEVDEILPKPKLDKFNFDDSQDNAQELPKECSICMEPFSEECVRLPCEHIYHCPCIEKWCTKKLECPLCRNVIPTQE